jgi:hypothetical protein
VSRGVETSEVTSLVLVEEYEIVSDLAGDPIEEQNHMNS